MKSETQKDELLSPSEVGDWLRVTRRTIDKWRSLGIRPTAFRAGPRKILYRQSDVMDWINASVATTTLHVDCTRQQTRAQSVS